VTKLTPGQMRTRLAAELDRSGYDYDAPIVSEIVDTIASDGAVHPQRLAQIVTATYLTRNGTDRQQIADVIARALGASIPTAEPASVTVSLREGDTNYNLQLTDQAQVGSLNVGSGTQVVVDASANRDAVLAAVAALVQSGLRDEWDQPAARALATSISQRDDVTMTDIQRTAAEVIESQQPKQSRVRAFLEKVAVGGLGGALGTGLAAGAGAVIQQLPM
jgi:hypothetical protein